MKKSIFIISILSLFFALIATRRFAPADFFEISSPSLSSDPLSSLEITLNSAENPSETYQSSRPVVASPKTFYFSGVERVNNTEIDAGNGIKIYKHMLYAHSTLAFNMLRYFNVGTIFTAEIDGQTATYRVASRSVFTKSSLNQDSSVRKSIYNAAGHDISLMTCGDGSASSNDPNYRLVLFADRV